MFTGLIEEVGEVVAFSKGVDAWRLIVRAKDVVDGLSLGDSVAVNGCCLTAVNIEGDELAFDLLEETLRLTSFGQTKVKDRVNLERSLAVGARLGGHFLSGHVDTLGRIAVLEERGSDVYLRIDVDPKYLRYVVHKGCIGIHGISLTVAEVDEAGFAFWIIPHTLAATNLQTCKAGDSVNLEFDLLAKYVEKLMTAKGD